MIPLSILAPQEINMRRISDEDFKLWICLGAWKIGQSCARCNAPTVEAVGGFCKYTPGSPCMEINVYRCSGCKQEYARAVHYRRGPQMVGKWHLWGERFVDK